MRRLKRLSVIALGTALLLAAGCPFEHKPAPPPLEPLHVAPAYDLWGESISSSQANDLLKTSQGQTKLAPANGAVKIDAALLALGKKSFYEETFGNEVFLTDVVGMLDGPITAGAIVDAITKLQGKPTTDLQVELVKDQTIGGKRFHEGEIVDTGLDVPAGAIAPLGMTIKLRGPRAYVGISCALCHSTVDSNTGKIIDGAPNSDLRVGLLLAMATNSAALFAHTDVRDFTKFTGDLSRTIETSDGKTLTLPDPDKLESAVDAQLLKWPPGCFDSMCDGANDPTNIPSSFTWNNWPYNWSGGSMAGPFKGLSAQNSSFHALNGDTFALADASKKLLGIDSELYYALLMQNAAAVKFRYDPASGKKPSEFFRSVDPTPDAPGMNQQVALPTYPQSSMISPTGLWSSTPGKPVWQQVNAMSAWQNTLVPPPVPLNVDEETKAEGREVFEQAGCVKCHSGPEMTNHRIISASEIGTQPVRAKAFKSTENNWSKIATAYAFDEIVPLGKDAKTVTVPIDSFDPKQVELAMGWGDSPGGYKVPSLIGLYYTAPYFHDGGVAVGPDPDTQLGVPGSVLRHLPFDPYQSLRAVVDRILRQKVIDANHANEDMKAMNIEGIGHEFWVDTTAGYSSDEQRAMLLYLLTYRGIESQ